MTNETNPGTVGSKDLSDALAWARNWMANASPEEKAMMWKAQRESWSKGPHGPTDDMGTIYVAAQSQPTVQEVGRDVTKDVLASLVAALSILNRAHAEHKEPRKVVSSDAMFAQMLKDYEASVVRARAALTAEPAAKAGDAVCCKQMNGGMWLDGKHIGSHCPVHSPSPQPDMGNVIANDALNLLDLIGKHIQDAEIWRKVHKDATELRDRLAALSSPASQSVEQMREALEPFATFAKTFVDDEGWIGPMNKERIVDWFGPSDFRRTAAALPHKEEATPAPVGETIESMIAWGDETFGPCEPSRAVSRAGEEWSEMVAEVPGTMQHAIEAADVIICLLRIPLIREALNAKMAKNRARRWKLMGDGTGYHIKEATPATTTTERGRG